MMEENYYVYIKKTKKRFFILSLCVDDILLAGNNLEIINTIKKWLSSIFEMKGLGEVSYVLEVKISRDLSMLLSMS